MLSISITAGAVYLWLCLVVVEQVRKMTAGNAAALPLTLCLAVAPIWDQGEAVCLRKTLKAQPQQESSARVWHACAHAWAGFGVSLDRDPCAHGVHGGCRGGFLWFLQ